jgi:LPXTG-motif cell wall-anchored protein
VFEDSLAYVLDYSSVFQANGGKVMTDDEIVWPGENIAPNQTLTKTFEVMIDNPIPQTPASTSDPNFFNLTMSNTYGNTITINLPSTPVQVVQQVSTTLPNTGPGNSVIIGAVVVAIAGYFLFRSRLIAKEVKIAITEQSGGAP